MSRTKNTSNAGPSNPAAKFLEWDSQEAHWKYYDKNESQNKTLPMDTPFIVLDQLNTVKGFNESKGTGLWSNEVRTVAETLTIKSKDGVVAVGKWADIKHTSGAKFTKSVYAMAKVGDAYEMVNFQFKGSSLTAWIEFVDGIGGDKALYEDKVCACKTATDEKKGAVKFKKPCFQVISNTLSDEAAAQADSLDMLLQDYLDEYFGNDKEPEATPEPEPTPSAYTEPKPTVEAIDEDLPF